MGQAEIQGVGEVNVCDRRQRSLGKQRRIRPTRARPAKQSAAQNARTEASASGMLPMAVHRGLAVRVS